MGGSPASPPVRYHAQGIIKLLHFTGPITRGEEVKGSGSDYNTPRKVYQPQGIPARLPDFQISLVDGGATIAGHILRAADA
eukprot:1185059-Prorocentrum_minimum.AAC.1